jgi:hypothetical protein
VHNSKNLEEDRHVVAVVRKASKQIQTQEQDDQWEWQRVWKGAFDKMHQQLQQKTEETEMLATENKVRALIPLRSQSGKVNHCIYEGNASPRSRIPESSGGGRTKAARRGVQAPGGD